VIHASNGPTAWAAAKATRTIPIVFSTVPDPVERGLVKTLSQPGGNITGVATFGGELGARRMQLLKEVLPKIRRVGVLVSASTVTVDESKVIEQAAGSGVKIVAAAVKTAADLESAFASLVENKCEAVLITQAQLLNAQRKAIMQLAAKHRMPVVGFRSEQVEVGALMSYNSSLADHTRRAAQLVDRVLKGKKPAEIPVEQPTTFELVINLKTAKSLGIAIPQSLLLQASRVIE
jgi:putative ABC transport system substrate-binding protein